MEGKMERTALGIFCALSLLAAPVPRQALTQKAREVLQKLRPHFMLGVAAGPGDRWIEETRAQGCRWDLRYQYLAGGVNTGNRWYAGGFVTNYIRESDRLGVIPVFTWYMIYQSRPAGGQGDEKQAVHENARNTETMRAYFSEIIGFMKEAGATGKTVIFHVEPDMWGFFLIWPDVDADKVPVQVKSTGLPELAKFDDNLAGFGRAIVALRDQLAPNVLLAFHASKWGDPNPKTFADAIQKIGKWDLVFTDPSDRDSAWKVAHNYHASGAWWKDSDFSSFRDWSGRLYKLTGLPMMAWQIPMGNTIMDSCNNTEGHYMDNRPEYFLENYPANRHIAEWAECGYVGLLFGGGAGGCTSVRDDRRDGVTNPAPVQGNKGEKAAFPDDDGGYMRLRGGNYYTKGPLPMLRRGESPSPREFAMGSEAMAKGDYARAFRHFSKVVETGDVADLAAAAKERIALIEAAARRRLAELGALEAIGESADAAKGYRQVARDYAGTHAAEEARRKAETLHR